MFFYDLEKVNGYTVWGLSWSLLMWSVMKAGLILNVNVMQWKQNQKLKKKKHTHKEQS